MTDHTDGVRWDNDHWAAYVNGRLVAAGPDKPIIEAAYRAHAQADEATWKGGQDDE